MGGVQQVDEEAAAGWSDLPGDLLELVYERCASPFDRARFAAVCTSWRTVVVALHPRLLLLPAMPLLLPSTGNGKRDLEARAYSPENGRAVRVPLPWFPNGGNRLVGSYEGGWIATTASNHDLLVVNLFSGARALLLSEKEKKKEERFVLLGKIIFSANPASSRCVMVAITKQHDLALRRVDGAAAAGWTTICNGNKRFVDITFVCNNNNGGSEELLYALTAAQQLLKFHIGVNSQGAPVANLVHIEIMMSAAALHVPGTDTLARHIFELRGNLAIALKVSPDPNIKHHFFKVFQLAALAQAGGDTAMAMSMSMSRWEEVTSLGDHALFLGHASSKALRVTSSMMRGAVKGNHIYYSHHGFYRYNNDQVGWWLDMGSCAVRCCQSKGTHHFENILSTGYLSYKDDTYIGCNSCIWLWPPDF